MEFKDIDLYNNVWAAAHAGCLYWQKVVQWSKGKVTLSVDGSPCHYTEEQAREYLRESVETLQAIENSPHWHWDGSHHVWVESSPEPSAMVYKHLTTKVVVV